jgi:CelD/BcsL family acetyltransferase involved in cellulose biosynthesis
LGTAPSISHNNYSNTNSGMKLTLVRTAQEFLGLGGVWTRALECCARPDLFLTFGWFRSWWEHLGQDAELSVFVLEDNKECQGVGIAPLMRRADSLFFLASHEVTDYCDFLFPKGREEEFHKAWLTEVANSRPGIKRIELINLRSTSSTLQVLPETARECGFVSRSYPGEEAPILRLPGSYQEYLAGLRRKNRHELRRKLRRTEGLPGIRLETIADPGEVPAALDEFISLHRSVDPDKDRFWQIPGIPEFFKAVLSRLVRDKLAALLVVYAEDAPIASLIVGHYGRTEYFYNVAYAPAYAAASPGYYVFDQAIRQAISSGREEADFLRGSEKYKFEFGAESGSIFNLILTKKDKHLT